MTTAHSSSSEPLDHFHNLDPSTNQLFSGDLIIGLIGFAGAGCTDVYTRLHTFLRNQDFSVEKIKLSDCISDCMMAPPPSTDSSDGTAKLNRARQLQNAGDAIREQYGAHAIACLAIRKVKQQRLAPSTGRRAIILDSIKHPEEVNMLRLVYDRSFLLLGVYCDRNQRLKRLQDKFYPTDISDIESFMTRDERDDSTKLGQQVKLAFHLADFFLDNSKSSASGHAREYDTDLNRFVDIMTGGSLIRPTAAESAMYAAYSAAQRSSCLSRQVGAAVTNEEGEVLATGSNEVPAYGGGVYHDGHEGEENRCFKWQWWKKFGDNVSEAQRKPVCHNTRKKNELKLDIVKWMGQVLPKRIAESKFGAASENELDLHKDKRSELQEGVAQFFETLGEKEDDIAFLEHLPGVGQLIEYSRSIHAEMDASLSAARKGIKVEKGSIYVTTYPCHNCARHLVAVGIREVRFLEPYDKSLAVSLHWDSIEDEGEGEGKMSIRPFTGVGPRVYEQYFEKKGELKDGRTGFVRPPRWDDARTGVRLLDLDQIENMAIEKLPKQIRL